MFWQSCSCCATVEQLLWQFLCICCGSCCGSCCEAVVLTSYCATDLELLRSCCEAFAVAVMGIVLAAVVVAIVQLLCSCCAAVVQLLCSCCGSCFGSCCAGDGADAVQLLSSCCGSFCAAVRDIVLVAFMVDIVWQLLCRGWDRCCGNC